MLKGFLPIISPSGRRGKEFWGRAAPLSLQQSGNSAEDCDLRLPQVLTTNQDQDMGLINYVQLPMYI